jgi:hypothetical protein
VSLDSVDVTTGLKRLDQIAEEEYGNDLAKSIAVADEHMSVRRLARITGIELKRPFATPRKIEGLSETGASQEWIFNDELLIPDAAGTLPLVRLKGNPAYEAQLLVYEELQRQHDLQVEPLDFGTFLLQAHSESNWFLCLLRAAQPYLCEEPREKLVSPPSPERRKRLWEVVSVAADDLATRAVEASIEPVVAAVCSLIPFLAGAPPAVAAGFSLFLVHYAKKGYCKAKIQQEIIQTLSWRDLS